MSEMTAEDYGLGAGWSMLPERQVVLCRTCMRPLNWETRTEPGFNPRTGWYDDARSDPLICFKSADYQHVPLTDREWAYYKAGAAGVALRVEAALVRQGGRSLSATRAAVRAALAHPSTDPSP